MANEEIAAGNKLIAEFMGFTVKDFDGAHMRYIDKNHENAPYYEWHLVRDLKYHTSYDWLMQVVDRLAELGWYYEIKVTYCFMKSETAIIMYAKEDFETPILCLFSCVVKAIEHYNLTKTNNIT